MRTNGFTLIELLVVVIIIATLTGIALPSYRRAVERSKAAEAMQVLPALFEARERYMTINQCTWGVAGTPQCPSGVGNPTVQKLDVEVNGTANGQFLTTQFFKYDILSGVTGDTVSYQPCVTAKPLWGGLDAMIYYRGDKFSCVDIDADEISCDILNVTPEPPASEPYKYRTGCI